MFNAWRALVGWLPSGHHMPEPRWRQRHHAILWVLWPHLPVLWLVGVYTGRGVSHVTGDIALLAIGAVLATLPTVGRRLRTLAAVATLLGCSSVLVHLTGGVIESHFHFFAVVAFITLYQEWTPFAVALAYVVGHHGLLGVLRPEAVYNHPAAVNRPVAWALIHGGFVGLASLANLAAWRLAEFEREQAEDVLNATGDGLYGVDATGAIIFVNPALCELLGRSRAALVGQDHHEALGHRLATGDPGPLDACPICASVRGRQWLVTGEAVLLASGAKVPVEYLVRPLQHRKSEQGSVVTLRDLRERRALEALRERAEAERNQLASVVEAASELALIGLPDGRLHWMNPAGRTLLGFDLEEDIGAYRIEDLFSEREMARIYAEDMPVIAREGSWQGEWVLQSRDGTPIPVAVTQHVHHDPHGERAYVSGIMRDLRPRLEQERKLRDSERRLAEAERVARLGSWEWTPDGTVMWSPAMYRLHGLEPGDGLETVDAWLVTVHPDDRDRALAVSERAVEDGADIDFTYRAVRAGGQEVVIRCRGEMTRDEHGQPVHMLGTLLDITDRHAAEMTLRASEERARRVISTAGDAYIEVDGRGRITDWNRQAETTFGWSREEALGRLAGRLIAPENDQVYARRLADHGAGGQGPGERTELTAVDRSGRQFPVELTVWPITPGDAPVFGSFVRDISERRAVERAKSEFVSVVSHELRTPLTSIHGALGLLGAGLLGQLTDRGQRLVAIAAENTDRLVRLINDILDIERLDAGQVSLKRQRCDAAVLAERSTELMRAMADQHGVQVAVDAEPVEVWADPDRIQQTLTNLLSNAIKYSPPSEQVRVSVRCEAGRLTVRVRDEGRGIPTDQLDAIFGRFQQVDASDSREKGGSGLGLAICQGIVEQHGGRIWAESAPGEGATFVFTLPWASTPATAGPVTQPALSPGRGVRGNR